MSKHKLFAADTEDFNYSSGSSTPGNSKSSFVSKLGPVTLLEGAKRKNNIISTRNAKKNMKKTKLESNGPGPSTENDCHPAFISDHKILKGGIKGNIPEDESVVRKTTEEKNFNYSPSSPEVSDFDSDIMEVDFFSKFNQKLPYSKQEDELILQYVLKGQNIFKVGSLSLWKYLEFKKDNPKRTYQSLKNRFLRNIKPYLFTTYRHLINNKETVDKILLKFPELKKQMGIRDTLTKIKLPARKSPSKGLETRAQASRDTDEDQENIEGTALVRRLKSNDLVDPINRPYQESSQTDCLNSAGLYRKVNFGKKSIFVSVSLIDWNHSETPVSSGMKINDRFKKLRAKRVDICSACGRYKGHLRKRDSSVSDGESDIMIPNSVDEGKKSLENLRKKNINSNLNNNQRIDPKIPFSNYSSRNSNSQSLLSYDDETDDLDKPAQDANEDSSKISNCSKSLTSKKKVIKVESIAKEVQVQEEPKTIISKKETGLGTEKQWDSDSEIDIIYESTMAGFRKLIDADEEKLLFRKCLYKNRDSIGFNSDSEKNLDSYFLESSPEVATPTLTENYSTLPQNDSDKTNIINASSSNLASNMMKMLAKEKDNKKS